MEEILIKAFSFILIIFIGYMFKKKGLFKNPRVFRVCI